MKKFLFLTLVFSALISAANAQTANTQAAGSQAANDQAATMLANAKKVIPQLTAATGLTEAQANKLIEINFETRMAAASLKGLSDEERSTKIAELKAAKDKKIAEFLTPDQIAAVKKFYEDMGKANQPQKANN